MQQGDPFEYSEARPQDTKNRQNSIEVEDDELQKQWTNRQEEVALAAKYAYDWAIDKGIAKEQAPKYYRRSNKNYTIYEWHIKKLGTLHRTTWCKWNTKRAYGNCSCLC